MTLKWIQVEAPDEGTPERLIYDERLRIVDAVADAAQINGWCDDTQYALTIVFPDWSPWKVDESFVDPVNEWYEPTNQNWREAFAAQLFRNSKGFDCYGYNSDGYNREGLDRYGRTRSQNQVSSVALAMDSINAGSSFR